MIIDHSFHSTDLIYNEGDAILRAQLTQLLEEGDGSVVVATLALNRLYYETGHWRPFLPELVYQVLDFLKTFAVDFFIVS